MHVRTYVLVLEECWNGVIVVVYYNGVSLCYIIILLFLMHYLIGETEKMARDGCYDAFL